MTGAPNIHFGMVVTPSAPFSSAAYGLVPEEGILNQKITIFKVLSISVDVCTDNTVYSLCEIYEYDDCPTYF